MALNPNSASSKRKGEDDEDPLSPFRKTRKTCNKSTEIQTLGVKKPTMEIKKPMTEIEKQTSSKRKSENDEDPLWTFRKTRKTCNKSTDSQSLGVKKPTMEIKKPMTEIEKQTIQMDKTGIENSHGESWTRLDFLGEGSFGKVYLAKLKTEDQENPNLPLFMAVKSAPMNNKSNLESVQREKEILSNLDSSRYVVKCYGDEITYMGDNEQVYNLLLEYCSGGSLERCILKSPDGKLPEVEVKRYTRDILRGLHYVHSKGYLHNDIKPANILLGEKSGEGYVAKLADFGSAMAAVNFSNDIRGFGFSVVEMMTGITVYDPMSTNDIFSVIGESDESDDAKDFLLHCLSQDPSIRWSSEKLLTHHFLSGI